jgi:hypothetical protein
MVSKNRPRKLIMDILSAAFDYAKEDYPGYEVSRHTNEIWVDRVAKDGELVKVLTIAVTKG